MSRTEAPTVQARVPASGWPAWWMRRGWLSGVLLPCAGLFAALAAARRLAYRHGWLKAWRAPVPVVVIGNVTVGGSGKTPLVLSMAEQLQRAGWKPGIVSRGYGRMAQAPEPMEVRADADPALSGDEPLLLRRLGGCPVWVGSSRPQAAQALLRAHPEVDLLLSDDGLQHLALARDLELVVVDARGPGNGWLLPAGPLREPWHRRRDATLGPREALAMVPHASPGFVIRRHLGAVRQLATGERLSIEAFLLQHAGQAIAAVAGIGHPEQFFAMLRQAGIPLSSTLALPDHHVLDADVFAPLSACTVLVTEKDALKCKAPQIQHTRLWAVELQLDVDPAFFPWLLAQLRARTEHPHGLTPA